MENNQDQAVLQEPDFSTLMRWFVDGECEATDGCPIEQDGYCEHGNPSWFIFLGLI